MDEDMNLDWGIVMDILLQEAHVLPPPHHVGFSLLDKYGLDLAAQACS